MFETLFRSNPALFIPVVAIVGTAVVFVTWIIAHYWHSLRRQEVEAALKQDMLGRGFSPQDIERVLVASSTKNEVAVPTEPEPISDNEYYLIEKMLDEGHSPEDIERLVRAFKDGKRPIRLPNRQET